jgi:hypothetical protein
VEGVDMANDPKKSLTDLKQCLKDAGGDAGKMATCQAAFSASPGTTTDGGKVFSIPDGSGVYVTDGGKVFSFKKD